MTSEQEYQTAADWAEHDMTLKPRSPTALRGAAATRRGREAVERALGGRPSIDLSVEPEQLTL